MSEWIDITTDTFIRTVRINRPAVKNAFTTDMYAAMADALCGAEEDTAIRAVVFLGVDGCFTAGNDLNDFLAHPPHDEDAPVLRFIRALIGSSVPLIAAVDGPAVGIGTTMLYHCDHVIVTEGAKLIMPFVNLGLVPENASSYLLPHMVGHTKAAEYLMLGRTMTGEVAHQFGIANELVIPEDLESAAMRVANEYASKPPAAMRKAKKLMRHYAPQLEEQAHQEMLLFREGLESAEAKEAMTAFLEKRKPDFSNLA